MHMNKQYYRIYLKAYERFITVEFYKQILSKSNKGKTIAICKDKLLHTARHLGLTSDEYNDIWSRSYSEYKVMQSQKGEYLPDIKIWQILNQIELRKKNEVVQKMRASNNIFWLCSRHNNCATDHYNWQGRVYIRRDWIHMIPDSTELREQIYRYIKQYDVRTLEWVMGYETKEIFMLTRPNCKHNFIPLSTEEVLSSKSELSLYRKHSEQFDVTEKVMYDTKEFEVASSLRRQEELERARKIMLKKRG